MFLRDRLDPVSGASRALPLVVLGGLVLAGVVAWRLMRAPAGPATAPVGTGADVGPAAGPQAGAVLAPIPGQARLHAPKGLEYKYELLDPAAEGWDAEVFARRTRAQLARVAQCLEGTAPIRAGDLEPLLDPSFACAALRPDELREVYAAGPLRVLRGVVGGEEPQRGAAGLAAALRALRAPFEEGLEVHTLAQILGLEQDGSEAVTTVMFRAWQTSPRGALQQNAVWRCRWVPGAAGGEPTLARIEPTSFEEVARDVDRAFVDCTAAVLGANPSFRQQLVPGINEWGAALDRTMGISYLGHEGLAIGDADGDGLEDLYVCQVGGLPNRLFRQRPDGTAADVSAQAGVDLLDVSHSALFVDLDQDGDQDLVVAAAEVVVLSNDGTGRFTLVTRFPATNVYALAAADYDEDGDLDLYLCRYTLSRDTAPIPYHDARNGPPNVLLRNDGDWRFSDVTEESGMGQNNSRFSFAAAWADYDQDGDVDLYVANDYGRNNLYRNEGPSPDDGKYRFVDAAGEVGVEDVSAGMSVSWGDYDLDGDLDLYVGNMFSAAGMLLTHQARFTERMGPDAAALFQRHARGNALFAGSSEGTFRDVSVEAGVTNAFWAWASLFVDVNNDGLEDLYVANGLVSNDRTGEQL